MMPLKSLEVLLHPSTTCAAIGFPMASVTSHSLTCSQRALITCRSLGLSMDHIIEGHLRITKTVKMVNFKSLWKGFQFSILSSEEILGLIKIYTPFAYRSSLYATDLWEEQFFSGYLRSNYTFCQCDGWLPGYICKSNRESATLMVTFQVYLDAQAIESFSW